MPEEIGYVTGGLTPWGKFGGETHEPNPDLQWPKSLNLYDRMRSEDSQVGSVLRAVTSPIQQADWVIDPAGARDEVVEQIAADLGLQIKGRDFQAPLRTRGRFSWEEHLRLALLELVFGHSVFEQVYRLDEANRFRLVKLAWRPPRTIASFDVARDGGLIGVKQHGVEKPIPVDRLVVYVNEREGANWLGRSLLRTAYKNWLLKDRLLRIQALTAERNGLGVAIYTAAPPHKDAGPEQWDAWVKSELAAGLKIAQESRAGDTAGASLPNGATLSFAGVQGNLPDTDAPIRYHDEQIARAVLAHFLNLGTETGSWALGSTFANFFTNSLNAVAQHIADVTQQHVIEDIVDRNWGPTEPAPRIVPSIIGAEHPATAEAIKSLIDSKAITPDPKLEAHIRGLYALPIKEQTEDDPSTVLDDSERALAAVNAVQKVYLGVGIVLTQDEARELVRRAGADLTGSLPAPPTPPTQESA
ncbi:hypothetical protein [Marisediminicola sp. LYQ134]|uniref:phage portal protein family protein n=1 Tax=Marisediminicola sp. LYQ134 TaxID=3391061 RepID=UPI0039831675